MLVGTMDRRSGTAWLRGLCAVLWVTVAGMTGGCAGGASHADFPAIVSDKKVLTNEEQARAMADLRRKSEEQPAEVLRQIETGSIKPQAR